MTRGKAIGKKYGQEFISPREQLKYRREFVLRDIRRRMIANGEIENKVASFWEWRYREESGSVQAHTRSQAKAQIKKLLGLSKKKARSGEIIIQKVVFK